MVVGSAFPAPWEEPHWSVCTFGQNAGTSWAEQLLWLSEEEETAVSHTAITTTDISKSIVMAITLHKRETSVRTCVTPSMNYCSHWCGVIIDNSYIVNYLWCHTVCGGPGVLSLAHHTPHQDEGCGARLLSDGIEAQELWNICMCTKHSHIWEVNKKCLC